MSMRAKLVAVLLLSLGVLGVLILATSTRRQLAQPAAGGVVERSPPPAADAERLPAPVGAAAAPAALLDEVPGPPSDASLAARRAAAEDLARRLREQLEGLAEQSPATFHEEAVGPLQDFAAAALAAGAPEPPVLVAALRSQAALASAPVVSGGLLAAAGGVGETAWALQMAAGEELRDGLAGLAWNAASPPGDDALVLHPEVFLRMQPRAGLAVLALPWSRQPQEPVLDWAWSLVREPATELETLLGRELAVFLVGTRVDSDAGTLSIFRQLLFDLDPRSQQLRPALVFVLAQARGEAARAVLQDFLNDPQAGEHGKTLARWWLSKGVPRPGDVSALVAPLLDPSSSAPDRTMAAGTLLARIGQASGDELAQMEDVLSLRALDEENATARLGAVSVLGKLPGGFQRLAALSDVLRRDAKPNIRSTAAHALGSTPEPFRSEALAQLRAALSTETDPGVREMIARMLAEAGG
ncbi:MAG TPA: HEAT repeat domain-containing protein [Planctomycetota bacterium]|nr:HEAT repeat domain-containing protein [Planctomycetota bacterium]